MPHFKQHMYQHLRSARQWLMQAEHAFEHEKDIRAELNLMLAQAEMQHIAETSKRCQGKRKYLFLRHLSAIAVAAVLLLLGCGSWYVWTHQQNTIAPVPEAQESQIIKQVENNPATVTRDSKEIVQPLEIKAESTEKDAQKMEPIPVSKQPETRTESTKDQSENSQVKEQTVKVSPDEIHKLVQAAGKSLRGQ